MNHQLRNVLVILLTLSSSFGCSPINSLPVVVPTTDIITDMPLSISLNPRLLVAEHEARISCRLPTNVGDGQFIFGITGMFHSEGPIDKRVYDRMIMAPCVPVHIYCGYKEHDQAEIKMIAQDVEPVGDCGYAHSSR